MRVGLIYVRQSRHRDYKRTVSPQVQEQGCRSLPEIAACDKVEVFVDLDKSGKSAAGRKEFQAFLKRLEEDPPHVVAVYDQSPTVCNTREAVEVRALMGEGAPPVGVSIVPRSLGRPLGGQFRYT